MTDRPAELQPCTHKGCPWRGPSWLQCPMHDIDNAWDRQHQLMTENPTKRQTRHRK